MAWTDRGLYSGAVLDEKGRRVFSETHQEAGLILFGFSEIPVVVSARSGVRRLEAVESYIHTAFLRPDAAKILRKYLDETDTQAETVQKLEAAEERLERVEAKLEGKLDRLAREGDYERRAAAAREAEEARQRVAFQLAVVRYYLSLLEEDEILLYLLTEH